jgi:hypothetical protein
MQKAAGVAARSSVSKIQQEAGIERLSTKTKHRKRPFQRIWPDEQLRFLPSAGHTASW